jgi:flagellar basal-body rod modification protein FlgD
MSIAAAANQQSQLAALTAAADTSASNAGKTSSGATSGTTSGTGSSGSASANSATATNALTSLSGNFQDFLGLLMTQLQNQDPSSPMDTNTFTSELVEFASVEQQINTNASLSQLIQVTQSGEILQSSAVVGKQVAVQSNQMPVQNGTGELQFTATTAGPVAIAVYNSAGALMTNGTVEATAGTNTWTWNAAETNGSTAPDGPYTVAVEGLDGSGNIAALPFNVVGTATGVTNTNGTLDLQMGAETINFTAVQSIVNN